MTAKKKTKEPRDPNKPKKLGGATGHGWLPGKSGNPGGRPKKFETLLSDAIREQLGEISPEDNATYAAVIAGQMVKQAAKEVKELGLTKEVLFFFREARDSTEGKPAQKIIIDGKLKSNPVERVKDLLSTALGRAAGALSTE